MYIRIAMSREGSAGSSTLKIIAIEAREPRSTSAGEQKGKKNI